MSYTTVFDITREAISLWFPVSFVFFGVLATIILWQARHSGLATKLARGVVLFFACLWVAAACLYFLGRRSDRQTYAAGQYKTVEGPVEHYKRLGKSEYFTVRGVEFCQGIYSGSPGWDPPFRLVSSGWPFGLTLREGLPVRVAYSDDPVPFEKGAFPLVLRLDVATNSR